MPSFVDCRQGVISKRPRRANAIFSSGNTLVCRRSEHASSSSAHASVARRPIRPRAGSRASPRPPASDHGGLPSPRRGGRNPRVGSLAGPARDGRKARVRIVIPFPGAAPTRAAFISSRFGDPRGRLFRRRVFPARAHRAHDGLRLGDEVGREGRKWVGLLFRRRDAEREETFREGIETRSRDVRGRSRGSARAEARQHVSDPGGALRGRDTRGVPRRRLNNRDGLSGIRSER